MTSADTNIAAICIERSLSAPPHAVYRAWLEPELVRRWMDPSGVRVIRIEIDERPGGAYRTWKADESGRIIGGFDSELLELSEELLGAPITPEVLRKAGVIKTKHPVKILGNGELTAAITVHAHKFSKSAQDKITQAGGKFEVLQ